MWDIISEKHQELLNLSPFQLVDSSATITAVRLVQVVVIMDSLLAQLECLIFLLLLDDTLTPVHLTQQSLERLLDVFVIFRARLAHKQ